MRKLLSRSKRRVSITHGSALNMDRHESFVVGTVQSAVTHINLASFCSHANCKSAAAAVYVLLRIQGCTMRGSVGGADRC